MTHIDRANGAVLEGHLPSLTETELKVWFVFHIHANGETGLAWPGTTKVAALVGHKDHKRVRQAIDSLTDKGFLILVEPATFKTPAKFLVGLPALEGQSAPQGVKLPPLVHIGPQAESPSGGQIRPSPGGQIDPAPGGQIGPPNSELNRETNSEGGPERVSGAKSGNTSRPGFDRWWETFPDNERRTGRASALAIWIRDDLEAIADQIAAHTAACSRSEQWLKERGRWIPSPTRYLAERRFEAKPPMEVRRVGNREVAAAHAISARTFDRDMTLNALNRGVLEQLAKDARARMPSEVAVSLANEDPRRSETLRWKMFELLEERKRERITGVA